MALAALFSALNGDCTGLSVVDSSAIAVCDNHRIHAHRTFNGFTERGKTSSGGFYGLKLHLIINQAGHILRVKLTTGNTDDRKPLHEMTEGLQGTLYGDKGYFSQALTQTLKEKGVNVVTKCRKNMKQVAMTAFDKAILRHRSVIETVFDPLKNLCQIEHARHRRIANFTVNLMAGIVAYCLQDKKPHMPVSYSDSAL